MHKSLTLSNTGSVNGIPWSVNIHVPSEEWLGRVQDGNYKLVTPDRYARSQMMSLNTVKRLIENREIPHICFTQQTYVLVRVPDVRTADSKEGPIWPS